MPRATWQARLDKTGLDLNDTFSELKGPSTWFPKYMDLDETTGSSRTYSGFYS
jgi:hypothetical protein